MFFHILIVYLDNAQLRCQPQIGAMQKNTLLLMETRLMNFNIVYSFIYVKLHFLS